MLILWCYNLFTLATAQFYVRIIKCSVMHINENLNKLKCSHTFYTHVVYARFFNNLSLSYKLCSQGRRRRRISMQML